MNIGDRYSESRMYRGIRTSNGLPFLSEDFHEFSDTISAKSGYLLESMIGSGILTEIDPIITTSGIKLKEPIVLNVQGDICLVKNSEDSLLVPKAELNKNGNTTEGSLFIIGWYQHMTASSLLREYGGVRNTTFENNLFYEPLSMQVSTRYQFCWDICVHEGSLGNSLDLTFENRDSSGNLSGSTINIKPKDPVGSIYVVDPPAEMPYVVDKLYVIPLLTYKYDTALDTISAIKGYPTRKTSNEGPIEISDTEPQGEFPSGTVWYNPITREFKTYIEGTGFISSASKMGFIQYQYVDIATTDTLTPSDIVYEIDVPSLQENDIIHTTYEGLELIKDVDYEINIATKTIKLLDFTRSIGEKLVVTVTRLVEANDVTNLTSTITTHIGTLGSSTVEGHVKLSDSIDSDSSATEGVAATPKAVNDSRLITDSTTNAKYRFGVENGILYIEEV